ANDAVTSALCMERSLATREARGKYDYVCRQRRMQSNQSVPPPPSQLTSPLPKRVTVQRAGPETSTSPLPMIETLTLSVAVSSTSPDPTIETEALSLRRPETSTSPDPPTETLVRRAVPRAEMVPAPPKLELAWLTSSRASSRSPDPAILTSQLSPCTRSMRTAPEPAWAIPSSFGTVM